MGCGSVRQRMPKTGLFDHIGQDHIFLSVDAAVQSFLSRPATGVGTSPATEAARRCP